MNTTSAFMFHRTFMNRFLAVLTATFAVALPASAQFKLDVSGVGMTQIPIAMTAFRGEDAAMQKISAIILADLARSGRFRAIDHAVAGADENTNPDFSALRQKGADAYVAWQYQPFG
jgi:TolB protein